jgi:RloB-like protein
MKKNKTTKRTVYILTEGETEEAYFARIGEIVGADTDWEYSVTVEVREIIAGSKTDPINIVKEAKKSKPDYDEVWVVFDKDRQRDDKNEGAFKMAAKAKINVAFSSISFEHWLILHFEKSAFAFQRSDCESRTTKANPIICVCNGTICAKAYLKQPAFYPSFEKGKALLYDDLKERNIIAIENAAWLRKYQSPYTDIHLLNPYADVDILLCELLNLNKVIYVSIGDVFIFEGVEITILSAIRNANIMSISISLNNQSQIAFAINNNQPFTLTDESGNTFLYENIQASILHPNSNQLIQLSYTVNPDSQSFRFKASTINSYTLVDI